MEQEKRRNELLNLAGNITAAIVSVRTFKGISGLTFELEIAKINERAITIARDLISRVDDIADYYPDFRSVEAIQEEMDYERELAREGRSATAKAATAARKAREARKAGAEPAEPDSGFIPGSHIGK